MTQEANMGKVIQVIGPVVDVEFPSGNLPKIYNALKIVGEKQLQEKILGPGRWICWLKLCNKLVKTGSDVWLWIQQMALCVE